MKMINHSIIALVVLMLNACSTSETSTLDEPESANLTATKAQEEMAVYIEELHYRSIMQEYGEEHELIAYYRERFEEVGATRPKGCPKPQPCDFIANCFDGLVLPNIDRLKGFSVGDARIRVTDFGGNPINGVREISATVCPKPQSRDFILEENLNGEGVIGIDFYSNELDEEFSFKLEFYTE